MRFAAPTGTMGERIASIVRKCVLLACLLMQGCALAGIRHPPTTPAEQRRYDCDGNGWLLAADALGLAFFGVMTGAALDAEGTHDATIIATVGPTLLLGTSLVHGLHTNGVCRDFVAARTRDQSAEPPAEEPPREGEAPEGRPLPRLGQDASTPEPAPRGEADAGATEGPDGGLAHDEAEGPPDWTSQGITP
jgi:hypothetical protein